MSIEEYGEIRIENEKSFILIRKKIREISNMLGFLITDITRIVTSASELIRNIIHYAGTGIVQWHIINNNNRTGIEMTFKDNGPGIPDIKKAMKEGYSTGNGLGFGLPGTKRLMDEMEIISEVGKGTTVIIKKWLKS